MSTRAALPELVGRVRPESRTWRDSTSSQSLAVVVWVRSSSASEISSAVAPSLPRRVKKSRIRLRMVPTAWAIEAAAARDVSDLAGASNNGSGFSARGRCHLRLVDCCMMTFGSGAVPVAGTAPAFCRFPVGENVRRQAGVYSGSLDACCLRRYSLTSDGLSPTGPSSGARYVASMAVRAFDGGSPASLFLKTLLLPGRRFCSSVLAFASAWCRPARAGHPSLPRRQETASPNKGR